jgi:hypothetical protein
VETTKPVETAKLDEAEAAANKSEWGIKYDDECFKFEKEWEVIS